jgi:transcription-repair coupling factor (superfamily II helicase)
MLFYGPRDRLFKGLINSQLMRRERLLTIEYAHGDKLYMPAEQINLLCRYRGSGSVKPSLSRMGGTTGTIPRQKLRSLLKTLRKTS